jgi:hypothetical protein
MAMAISRLRIGLKANARIPMARTFFSSILALKPVQRITGISGGTAINCSESRSPVIFGIVISVITKSNLSGRALKSSRASTALDLTST